MKMTDELALLKAVCPPPEGRAAVSEGGGKYPFPGSHGELVRSYGTGCFDDFIWIFSAGARNVNLNLDERTAELRSSLHHKKMPKVREILERHQAGPADLVQWGVTDNADVLCWIGKGDPEEWPTVLIQAGQLDAVVSQESSAGTLLRLFSRGLVVPFFPEDFPEDSISFHPGP